MSVFEFRDPWIHKVQRRCRVCRALVEVILLNGATAPSETHYRCSDCLDTPEATPGSLAVLADRESARPQLTIVTPLEEADRG